MDSSAVPVPTQSYEMSPHSTRTGDNEHMATTPTIGKKEDNNITEITGTDAAAVEKTSTDNPTASEKTDAKPKRSWRFWAIFASLAVTGLLSAVEGTVTTTALPTIVADLGGGELYIWAANGYFLTR